MSERAASSSAAPGAKRAPGASRAPPAPAAPELAGPPERPWLVALAVLCALALAARLAGLGALLPHVPEPDDVIVWQARWIEGAFAFEPPGAAELDPDGREHQYPLLLGALTSLLPSAPPGAADLAEADVPELLSQARWPHVRARLVVILLSWIGIPATYFLARAWLSPGRSLLAAALVATSLLHAFHSGQARPHGALAALAVLASLAVLRLAVRPTVTAEAIAGVAVGLCCACLHSGFAAVPGLALAQIARARSRGARTLAFAPVSWALVGVAVYFAWPALTGRVSTAELGSTDAGVLVMGEQLEAARFDGSGGPVLARYLLASDPVLALFALAGAVPLVRRGWNRVAGRREVRRAARARARGAPVGRAAALAFPLIYAVVFALFREVYDRFLLPLVPFLAILAAPAMAGLASWIQRWFFAVRRAAWVGPGILALILALPLLAQIRLAALRVGDDTLTTAARWIEASVSRERAVVAVPAPDALPLVGRDARLPEQGYRSPWMRLQVALGPDRCAALGYRFVRITPDLDPALLGALSMAEIQRTRLRAIGAAAILLPISDLSVAAVDPTYRASAGLGGMLQLEEIGFDRGGDRRGWGLYALGNDGLEAVLGAPSLGPTVQIHALPPMPPPAPGSAPSPTAAAASSVEEMLGANAQRPEAQALLGEIARRRQAAAAQAAENAPTPEAPAAVPEDGAKPDDAPPVPEKPPPAPDDAPPSPEPPPEPAEKPQSPPPPGGGD